MNGACLFDGACAPASASWVFDARVLPSTRFFTFNGRATNARTAPFRVEIVVVVGVLVAVVLVPFSFRVLVAFFCSRFCYTCVCVGGSFIAGLPGLSLLSLL